MRAINKILTLIFITFFFLMLCFGREFSILSPGGLVYITEIVLFLTLFIILFNLKASFDLPRLFLIPAAIYFGYGCLYLFYGIFRVSLYALRDVVYCGYMLFLLVTLAIFSCKKQLLKTFLFVVIISNLIGVIIVRLSIYASSGLSPFHEFFGRVRAFNYLLYFGITISFLVSFFNYSNLRKYRPFLVFLCIFNLYLLFIWGVRTSWVAFFVLAAFFSSIINKKKLLKSSVYLIPALLLLSVASLAFHDYKAVDKDVVSGKFASISRFILRRIAKAPLIKKSENKDSSKADETAKIHQGESALKSKTAPKFIRDHSSRLDIEKESSPDLIYNEIYQGKEKHRRNQEFIDYFANIVWRMDVWDSAIQLGLKNPILGAGFGVYPIFVKSNRLGVDSKVTPTHNHLISIFYKMGFLGLSLFLFINFYAFLFGLRYLKHCKDEFLHCFLLGALGSFVFWHAMALFFDVIDSPATSIFLWIIIGLIFAAVKTDKENNPNGLRLISE